MANLVKLKMQKEQNLDQNLNPVGECSYSLYICCDEIESWLSYIEPGTDVEKLISDKNDFNDLLEGGLSEFEYEHFKSLLDYNKKYYYYDKEYEY